MTWLLADEPRLGKAARNSWCQPICRTASSLCSNRSPTFGQSSSSRRIHTQEIRRMPASMPLVQCTPVRNGFARHQERSWCGGGLGVALVLRQPPGGRQHGEVVVPGHLPDLLDVARLRLVAMVDAEGEPSVRRPAPGQRVMEPVRVGAVGPAAFPAPSRSRQDMCRRRGSARTRRRA